MKKPVYIDFTKIRTDYGRAAWEIKNTLVSGGGSCILKNVPVSEDNSFLQLMANYLGESVHEARNIDGKAVYIVEVNENLEVPTYANTPYKFLCHTDCTEFDNPPDTVMLLCEKQAKKGGESFLVSVEDIINRLNMEDIMILSARQFPFGNKLYPILGYHYDQPVMRYNRVSLDSFRKFYNFKFAEETLNVIDKMDAIMDEIKISFKLKAHECLIINNKTLLHGRGEFPAKSPRRMKRLRLNLK
jgi:alpha-ketoglutarate-dependent taurine dioxygenase